jgi:hypothetical protein
MYARPMRAILPFAVALATLTAASCGGSSGSSSGGAINTVSGDMATQFSPTFVGYASVQGTCTCPTYGGPASYAGVVVLMSDDPNLQAQCTAAPQDIHFDFPSSHYLTIQVVSTSAVAAGTYTIENPLLTGPFATLVESRPVTGDASGSAVGFVEDDNDSGTVTIDQIGSVVRGSFDASGLEPFGQAPSDGTLSGSFQAPLCQSAASASFQSPCSACPG